MRSPVEQLDGPTIKAARAAVCVELSKHSVVLPTLTARLATAEEKLASTEAQRDRLQEERIEIRHALRSLQGKLTEQAHTISSQVNELLSLRTRLENCDQELAKIRSEQSTTLEQLRGRDQALVQAQHHLQLVRESCQLPPRSLCGDGEAETDLQRAWLENDQILAELETAREELSVLQQELTICKANLEFSRQIPAVSEVFRKNRL
jgi:chromosome segregation ATPase